ncbi:MAG TPA: signal peptidase II [Candidatus Binatia bacterium]
MSAQGGSKWMLALVVAISVVVLDQATKAMVASTMRLHQSIPLIDGVAAFTYVRNTGAAFGILAGRAAALRTPFFLVISGSAVLLLLWFLRGLPAERRLLVVACGAVAGGALGNMIDRAMLGEVIDFVDLSIGTYHWPAFNVADSAITLGVIVLCLDALRQPAPTRVLS